MECARQYSKWQARGSTRDQIESAWLDEKLSTTTRKERLSARTWILFLIVQASEAARNYRLRSGRRIWVRHKQRRVRCVEAVCLSGRGTRECKRPRESQ